jgi:hypothetical protein
MSFKRRRRASNLTTTATITPTSITPTTTTPTTTPTTTATPTLTAFIPPPLHVVTSKIMAKGQDEDGNTAQV